MLKKELKTNFKGFTLVETIMYVAIIGFVVSAFVAFSLSIAAIRNKNYAISETQANARIALAFITDKIRASQAVIEPLAGQESTVLNLDMLEGENLIFRAEDGVLQIYSGIDQPYFASSPEIEIVDLHFNNITAPGEKDSIAISLSLKYRFDSSPEFAYLFTAHTLACVKL